MQPESISHLIPQILPAMIQSEQNQLPPKWKRFFPSVRADIAKEGIDDSDPVGFAQIVAKLFCRETIGGKGLLLFGVPGSGKTRRMKYIKEAFPVSFIDAKDVEAAWKEGSEEYFLEFIRVIPPRWDVFPEFYNDLIIDDLGTEEETSTSFGNRADVMRRTIEKRYTVFPRWKTHFSTNLTEAELQARYGLRVWSRLNEMCTFVSMRSADRRLSK